MAVGLEIDIKSSSAGTNFASGACWCWRPHEAGACWVMRAEWLVKVSGKDTRVKERLLTENVVVKRVRVVALVKFMAGMQQRAA